MKQHDSVLTQREREVLGMVARGLTNKEIADSMCTSLSAVKVFLHQASAKLGARNRAQAVILALKRGAIYTEEVYSLEEIADLLASLGPETIEKIAELLRDKHEKANLLPGIE